MSIRAAPVGPTGITHSADSMMNAIHRPSCDQAGPQSPRSESDRNGAGEYRVYAPVSESTTRSTL